jgi:hypothetical protein
LALAETLKLLFNITHFYPHKSASFSRSIPNILKILSRRELPSPPLQPPINYLINSLINLDLEDKKNNNFGSSPVFPKFDHKCNAEKLIEILDLTVRSYSEADLDQQAAPLLTLLRRVYEIAPPDVQKVMQWLILPNDKDRNQPLGRSDTLSSRLLRLSTSAVAPALRDSISSLFFELSDKDATSFVHNVGYGFASGFLMTHNLPVPENALEAWSTNESSSSGSGNGKGSKKVRSRQINPITGQALDAEAQIEIPEMSQEEKEREAEKLFVLFER